VAALFAWHQGSWRNDDGWQGATNLGASLHRLAAGAEGDSVERRFVALLNSHAEDLSKHLRHAVGLLKANEIPIDWAQLLHDIQGWEWQSRQVQREWAKSFWGDDRAQAAAPPAGADIGQEPAEPVEAGT